MPSRTTSLARYLNGHVLRFLLFISVIPRIVGEQNRSRDLRSFVLFELHPFCLVPSHPLRVTFIFYHIHYCLPLVPKNLNQPIC